MCIYFAYSDFPADLTFDYDTHPNLHTKEETYPGCAHRYVRIYEACPEARERGSRCPQPEYQFSWDLEVGYCLMCAATEPTETEKAIIQRLMERKMRKAEAGPSRQ